MRFRCPECTAVVAVQSRAGRCNLDEFTLLDAPPTILLDLEEDGKRGELRCKKCNTKLAIKLQIITHAVVAYWDALYGRDDDDYFIY